LREEPVDVLRVDAKELRDLGRLEEILFGGHASLVPPAARARNGRDRMERLPRVTK
jgi:hypothetical protein